jgi:hypothetical protein
LLPCRDNTQLSIDRRCFQASACNFLRTQCTLERTLTWDWRRGAPCLKLPSESRSSTGCGFWFRGLSGSRLLTVVKKVVVAVEYFYRPPSRLMMHRSHRMVRNEGKENGMIRDCSTSRDRVHQPRQNDELEPTFDRFVDVAVLQKIVI